MVKKLLKIIPKQTRYIVFCIALTIILVIVLGIRIKANNIGSSLGETLGSDVGKAMGSFAAMTDYREAYAEGKEEGLSAEDTTAEVIDKVQDLKKLEVLVAAVKLSDVHRIKEDYAALYLLKGETVFTVDFGEAEIKREENTLSITIPEPEMELIIDQSKIEKAAEYQKHYFKGDAEDGFDAYLASMEKITNNAKEALANYDELMETAKESARKQVEQLVNAVSVTGLNVEIMIQSSEKDN